MDIRNLMKKVIGVLLLLVCVVQCAKQPAMELQWWKVLGRFVVTTADHKYTVGQLASKQGLVTIHSDAIVRAFPNKDAFYVVNRLGQDNIQVVSKTTGKTLVQYSVGRSTNPQDIVVLENGNAYISRFRSNRLLKVEADTGKVLEEKKLDLTDVADDDGFVEMTRMILVGKKLLVQLQRLDTNHGFIPYPGNKFPSLVAVVDTETDTVEKEKTAFSRANPVTDFKMGPEGDLYVGLAGRFGELDGGIERLDSKTLTSKGLVIDGAALGGNLLDFEILSPALGVALVASQFKSLLVSFNPVTRKLNKVLWDPGAFSLIQLVLDRKGQKLYVADRGEKWSGIRVYNAITLKEEPGLEFKGGLPPSHLTLLD